jgi:nucleoside-diphosphate-sugar epimerase
MTGRMRILVTGARGKVGAATVAALHDAGHEVTALDIGPPVFEAPAPGAPPYFQADLSDAGDAFAAVRGHDAVIHAAAIPAPGANPAAHVFRNNLMGTFNVIEAAVRFGVPRVVNVSSETVPGFYFAERMFLADYAPIDEKHPIRPQDPYALSKHFGEQLMDAATRRSDLTGISVRPSWVQWEGNIEADLKPGLLDPESTPSASFWSYIDAYDLADALRLAAEADTPGHEVIYIASPDNCVNRPTAELIRACHGDAVEIRAFDRPDASGISCAKAAQLIGYAPTRSWRDYLNEHGELLPEARERLERGDTGVQRGKAWVS